MARFDDWVTDPRGQAGERRGLPRRSEAYRRAPSRPVRHLEKLGKHGHAGDLCAGPRRSGDVRRVDGGSSRTAAFRRAALLGIAGRRRARCAGRCDWRSFRKRSLVAARLPKQSLDLQPEAFRSWIRCPSSLPNLNAYQPAFLASYPTMLALLAEEKKAGRLKIRPLRLWSGGECLPSAAAVEIARAFGCPVVNEYGASECMSIAFGCNEGWLHVNADWVLLEPVDKSYRPAPPGEPSHTALLTNLANRVQPIIRYDLGDSVIAKPEPCACGSPLPAIQVEGRRDDVVSLCAPDGSIVRLMPLALTTVVEEAAQVHRFQIVQTGADRLMLRLDTSGKSDRQAAWRAASSALHQYLKQQSLPNVRVVLDKRSPIDRPPQRKTQGSHRRKRRRESDADSLNFPLAIARFPSMA